MANLNKVFLMGNLTADPELRYTPKGTAVTDIRLAINRYYAGDNSERQEETTFVDVTLWNRQAEVAGNYLSKGRGVFVEGRLQLDSWEDKASGQKRTKLRVIGENIQLFPAAAIPPTWRRPPPAVRSPFQQLRAIPGPSELQSSPHAFQPAAIQRLWRHGRRDSILKPQESIDSFPKPPFLRDRRLFHGQDEFANKQEIWGILPFPFLFSKISGFSPGSFIRLKVPLHGIKHSPPSQRNGPHNKNRPHFPVFGILIFRCRIQ